MRLPQFKLRSLLVLVLLAGLILAVGVLSLQNHRLRMENAKLQVSQQSIVFSFPSQALTWSGRTVIATDQTTVSYVVWNPQGVSANDIPNGLAAFTKVESAR
jgi:hypothetical protein